MLIELKNGKRKEFKPAVAKVLIARKLGKEVTQGYQTRMMTAAPVTGNPVSGYIERPAMAMPDPGPKMVGTITTSEAPYGYKADGTPRKIRPAK